MNKRLNDRLALATLLGQVAVLTVLIFKYPSVSVRHLDFAVVVLTFLVISTFALLSAHYLRRARELLLRKTRKMLEVKNRLVRQREALLRLASSQFIFYGTFEEATRGLIEVAADTVGVSRAGVWLFSDDRRELRCSTLFERSTGRHTSGMRITAAEFPQYFELIRRSRVLAIDDVRKHPAGKELGYLRDLGVYSVLDAPVYSGGELVGVVCLSHLGPPRRWKIDEQDFVGSLADMVALSVQSHARRRAERELESKSIAIACAMDGIAVLDANETYVYVNDAHARIYGYGSPQELIGRNWRELYSQEELARFETALMPEFRRRGELKAEAVGKRRDGQVFAQEICLNALPDGGLVCIVRDTSQRAQAAADLEAGREFLRKVVDSDPNLIFVKDASGRFTLANQAVADVYGTTTEAIIGKSDADFNPNAAQVARFQRDDQEVLSTGIEKRIVEEPITDKDGRQHWLQTVKRRLALEGGEFHVLGVSTDITERKRLEDQLLQSQKMEAIGQLAGGVAHDFNNLLTAILGYTGLLKISYGRDVTLVRTVEQIENTASHAAQLTQKLLGFARKGKHQNVNVDVHALIDETLAILRRTIETNISINLDLSPGALLVRGDPVQIQQIFLNLAINARDAMSLPTGGTDGGRMEIRTRKVEIPNDETPITGGLRDGRYAEVTVRDTGCGIPPENLSRIFEPFFTTKEAGKGTGMGLAMVYGIVKNHGGAIAVQSTAGHGANFHVYFPLASEAALVSRVEKVSGLPAAPIAQHERACILLVDDHRELREVTARMLSTLGYQVATACDGVEALEYYRENYHEIDLVIVDMIMPKMGAREFVKAMREINPEGRAVLSTGYASNHLVQEILNEGISGFMQKPYQLDRLSRVVAAALRRD